MQRRDMIVLGRRCAAVAALAACGWLWITAAETAAQRPAPPPDGAAGLWISASPLDQGRQLLLVVDPRLKNAAVYHVDAAAGTLTLKSTRDITYDLMVGDFNAQAPKPADLRAMLQATPRP